jgi:mono/diheme cytochrome c family protein
VSRNGIFCAALLILAILISACNSHTERPPNPDQLIQDGQPLYVQNCAECHQTNGIGKPGQVPRLAGNPIVTLEDPIPAINIVSYGKGAMPGFGDKLDGSQIADILSYIRNAWGNQAPAVDQRQIP